MYRAQDVMSTNIITICADATVEDAIRSLLQHQVSGAPIVDDQERLVGIVSEFQLLEAVYRPDVKKEQVRKLMTKDVITVTENATLSDVTNMLLFHRIRRVPVVRNGKVVGIIARRDLLRYIIDAENTPDDPPAKVKASSKWACDLAKWGRDPFRVAACRSLGPEPKWPPRDTAPQRFP